MTGPSPKPRIPDEAVGAALTEWRAWQNGERRYSSQQGEEYVWMCVLAAAWPLLRILEGLR